MNYSEWHQIAQQAELDEIVSVSALSTSALNQSWQLTSITGQRYWARTCLARHQALIDGEVENLSSLEQAGVHTAKPLAQGKTTKTAWFINEWQTLSESMPSASEIMRDLSHLHQQVSPTTYYGWPHANDINGLVQTNHWLTDWASFYRSQRLLPQLRKAKENGLAQRFINSIEHQLMSHYEICFEGYQPKPSLVHGNLYQSPARMTLDGRPFYYHPACYYGDADVDFAGIWLREKRDALVQGLHFEEVLELSAQSQARIRWYQLYYALVEFNLMTQQDSRLTRALVERLSQAAD